MPVAGDTQTRFGRSYIYVNPDPTVTFLRGATRDTSGGTVGTWRLSVDDEYVPGGGDDPTPGGGGTGTEKNVVYSASNTESTYTGSLLYLDSSGEARLALADSIATANVIGAAASTVAPGNTVKLQTNVIDDFFTTSTIVDNDLGGVLATGFTYYLSAVNPGHWTLTPDTTTPGAVVVQCGQAVGTNQMLVEIQIPTEV